MSYKFISILLFLYCSHILNDFAKAIPESAVQEYLKSHLSSFDLIDSKWIISKRSLGMEIKTVQLMVFNRTFNLILTPVKAETIDPDHFVSVIETEADVRSKSDYSNEILNGFYTGYVEGDQLSKVKGYFTGNQLLCTIYLDGGEVLSIEPLSKFTGNLSDTQLLAYYDSQLRDSSTAVPIACGANKISLKSEALFFNETNQYRASLNDATSSRWSRSTKSDRHTCSLQVVADHSFYGRIGMNQIGTTMRTIVKIIDDANEVFFATELPNPTDKSRTLPPIGFKLSSIVILKQPDKRVGSFNKAIKPKKAYSASELLMAFSKVDEKRINLSHHCLNHLLTYRRMQRNVLGLARVGTPCSYSNVGLTSHSQSAGFPLLFRQAVLVTAHELGHNLGSTHDPQGNLKCVPESSEGGPYLMHSKSVLGFDKNNDKFSPCSIKDISLLVEKVLLRCFNKSSPSLCGNHRRDPGENCDSGLSGDACCHSNCSLRSGAECSDANSPCCNNCKRTPKGAICLPESPLRPCRQPSRCSGASADCPSPSQPAPDNSVCNSGVGRCFAGVCKSACHPSLECACPESRHSCLLCCRRPGANRQCLPLKIGGRTVPLPVDWPCHSSNTINGFTRRCQGNGTCSASGMIDSVRGGTGEAADLLPSGRTGVRLMQLSVLQSGGSFASNNIVFITLIVTLVIYVPICLICHYRDKRIVQADGENAPHGDITFDVTHDKA